MVKRKKRYELLREMYLAGEIRSLEDIFNYVAKSVVARDMGMTRARFSALLLRPGGFTIKEIYLLGRLAGIKERQIYELVEAHYLGLRTKRLGGLLPRQPLSEKDRL